MIPLTFFQPALVIAYGNNCGKILFLKTSWVKFWACYVARVAQRGFKAARSHCWGHPWAGDFLHWPTPLPHFVLHLAWGKSGRIGGGTHGQHTENSWLFFAAGRNLRGYISPGVRVMAFAESQRCKSGITLSLSSRVLSCAPRRVRMELRI